MLKVIKNILKFTIVLVFWGMILFPKIVYCIDQTPHSSLSIYDVFVDKDSFNPSSDEKVKIQFRLSEKAKVTLKMFDCDQELISTLCEDTMMEKGDHILLWDGWDRNGRIVPDEAYFFTIETLHETDRTLYDPTTFSGGIIHEIERVKILKEQKQLEYFLQEKGRVCIKVGIVDGALLAIPLDWKPRPKGLHKEYWDGMDQDKLISILEHPRYQIRASYFTLPENTIITTGNKKTTFVEYKLTHNTRKIKKIPSASKGSKSILTSPLYNAGILYTKAPAIDVTFPQTQMSEKGTSIIKDSFRVKVDFLNQWKPFLSQKQYEIYFFLDHQFLMEEPWISLPYETLLDVKNYSPDNFYMLSVNIISPGGQIGIKSKKVELQ